MKIYKIEKDGQKKKIEESCMVKEEKEKFRKTIKTTRQTILCVTYNSDD